MMGQKPENRPIKIIQKNKKAFHEFDILQKYEAGIVLSGPEVKSIREGKCSLQDAYCLFKNTTGKKAKLYRIKNNKTSSSFSELELFIKNLHIAPYSSARNENYNPKADRKLLLNKKELIRLKTALDQKGLTLIPLSIYFSGPFVKLELGLGKGKKKFDKREEIKKRDVQKEFAKKFKI